MELLPGLRPSHSALETPKPGARESADPSREAPRFEEHLKQVNSQRRGDDAPSRAEKSAARARSEAAKEGPARGESPANQKTQSAQGERGDQPAAETDPKSAQQGPASKPAAATPTAEVDRSRPELAPQAKASASAIRPQGPTTEGPGLPAAAADSKEVAPTPVPILPTAVPPTTVLAPVAPSVPTATSLQLGASAAVLGAAPAAGAEGSGTAGDTLAGARPAPAAHASEATLGALTDVLARSGPVGTPAPHDFAHDLAQLLESTEARAALPTPPQGHSQAAAEILRQVRVGLSADLREANIQLAPEALGRVSIRLRVEHGALTADVRAESSQALRALELHAPELKAALAQHGVEPRAMVFSFTQGQAGDSSGYGHASNSRSPRASFAPLHSAPVQLERVLARRMSASGVDTYA